MLTLEIQKRDTKMNPASLRSEGHLPAVLYGRKEESTPISIDSKVFEKVWREAGESTILSLEGVGEAKEALIHDVSFHPVTDEPLHADFYVIEKGKKLQVSVPLEFVGESPAVKGMNGTLVKVIHELDIEVLPKDLPHGIEVDISRLVDFDSHIAVKDLKLPEGVVARVDGHESVVSVAAPKEEIEEESAAIDMDAIEVEAKGKEDKEGEKDAAS